MTVPNPYGPGLIVTHRYGVYYIDVDERRGLLVEFAKTNSKATAIRKAKAHYARTGQTSVVIEDIKGRPGTQVFRIPPYTRSLSNPFTGAEVGLALLGLGAVGGLVWWATKSGAGGTVAGAGGTVAGTVDFNTVAANMQSAGAQGLTTCPAAGTTVILADTSGGTYYASVNGCSSSWQASVTVQSASPGSSGSILAVGTTYTNVTITYLSSA